MEITLQLPRDINKLCRTCMNISDPPQDSFDDRIIANNKLTELGEILEDVTQLKINVEDCLPESICSECSSNLNIAYNYKLRCKEVESKLQSMLANVKHEKYTEPNYCKDKNFTCQHCLEEYTTYYQLCQHMIKVHKGNKTITEQFYENQYKESKEDVSVIKLDVIRLIEDRKRSIDVVEEATVERLLKEKEYKCKLCFQKLDTKKELHCHICKPLNVENSNIENGKLLTNCTVCDKICADACSLSLHFLKHTFMLESVMKVLNIDEEFIFCEICGQLFESNLSLEVHYNEKHNGKLSWTCSLCNKVFEKEAELLNHNDTHSELNYNIPDKIFQCVLCISRFKTKDALLKHAIAHLKKKYICRKCLLSFCTQRSYEDHLKCHFDWKFVCPTCDKILSTKSALKAHIIGVHSVQLLHKCNICSKKFATQNRLNIHLKIHSATKKHICTYCGYSSHKVGDLRIHIRIHTCERPYKCTFLNCEMSFKTSSHLCQHVRRHLNVRKFKCTICSLAFTTNNGLKIHHMQHSGERPHTCQVCEQTFRRKYHLKVHMKQHGCDD